MKRAAIRIGAVTILGVVSAAATGAECDAIVWCDAFDEYLAGIPVVGQDCVLPGCPEDEPGCPAGLRWEAWDVDPDAGQSPATTDEAQSPPNSVAVLGGPGHGGVGSDAIVHTYHDLGLDSGVYDYSASLFIPEDYSGQTYFILLNQYVSGGVKNWSTQLHFDSPGDLVISDFDDALQFEVPFVRGAWAEVRIRIDFDGDWQHIFYNDRHVVAKSWSDGLGGRGATTLAAVALVGNDASVVYWDDLGLCRVPPLGACCLEDGTCLSELLEEECETIDHAEFRGVGSTCTLLTCPVRGDDGWLVDLVQAPGGPGVEFTFARETRAEVRESCDEVGTGSFDEQWVVSIPWAQDWTFSVCGASFDSVLTAGTGPCLHDLARSEDECGDDAEFTLPLEKEDVVYLTLEGGGPAECGPYDLVVRGRCPDLVRDPDAIVDPDEVPCFDGDTDPGNIGCNAEPGMETFSEGRCDTVLAGTVGNFTFDGAGRRDLDWYRLDLRDEEEPMRLHLSAVGQFPELLLAFADLDEDAQEGEECAGGFSFYETETTRRCGEAASIDVEIEPGLYTVIVASSFAVPEDVPCGDLSYYELTIACDRGCDGDADDNWCVEFIDIIIVLHEWGTMGESDGDVNRDGTVDFADLLVVLSNWGCGC